MNEAETRAEHIDPALVAADWGAAELYESMAQEGFSQFLSKFLGALFRAPK